jgi:hypothetical protein
MNRMIFGLVVLLGSSGAFAKEQTRQPDPLVDAGRSDCFSITFVRERRVLDSRQIVVWSSGKSPYLVRLGIPLDTLKHGTSAIAFVDGDGDGYMCRSARDAVIVQDALLPRRSSIIGVTELNAEQIRKLEVQYNTSLMREKRGQHGSEADKPAQEDPPAVENPTA